jgi:hypothetical protein
MAKVQEKMKHSLEKQTMSIDSLERLSNALHTTTTTTLADNDVEEQQAFVFSNEEITMMTMDDDVEEEKEGSTLLSSKSGLIDKKLKGENIAPKSTIHKRSDHKSKHGFKKGEKKEPKEKRRPRYFVQF